MHQLSSFKTFGDCCAAFTRAHEDHAEIEAQRALKALTMDTSGYCSDDDESQYLALCGTPSEFSSITAKAYTDERFEQERLNIALMRVENGLREARELQLCLTPRARETSATASTIARMETDLTPLSQTRMCWNCGQPGHGWRSCPRLPRDVRKATLPYRPRSMSVEQVQASLARSHERTELRNTPLRATRSEIAAIERSVHLKERLYSVHAPTIMRAPD